MKGRIPSNIDLDKLVRDLEDGNRKRLREDKRRFILEGMVYILNQLTYDVYSTDKRKDGFKRLNNKILEDIIGQKRPKIIFDILLEKRVIELQPKINRFLSTGYRLTQKYNTGKYTEIEYSERINRKLVELKNLTENDVDIDVVDQYEYLRNQFNGNNLTIKTFDSYEELRNILIPLLNQSLQKKRFKTETVVSLLNLIGGYKHKLEDLKEENYRLKLSSSNLRFNSNITSLKKELRQYLRFKGEKLVEVDIKSSQPFILSTILTENFTTSVEPGYNLFTIYPELYEEIQEKKPWLPKLSGVKNFVYLLGVQFPEHLLLGLNKFIDYDFHTDFYDYILNNGVSFTGTKEQKQELYSKGRSVIKDYTMNFLFERNLDYKYGNMVLQMITSLFPELSYFIDYFNGHYSTKFSYLLQRTESYLVLKKVCGFLNENHPDIPFFTIHDSILTTWESSSKVKDIMTDVISEVTGKTPVTSIKENLNSIDLDETWGKVNITHEDKFETRKYSVSRVNVQKGLSLINDEKFKSEVKDIIKPFMRNYNS